MKKEKAVSKFPLTAFFAIQGGRNAYDTISRFACVICFLQKYRVTSSKPSVFILEFQEKMPKMLPGEFRNTL